MIEIGLVQRMFGIYQLDPLLMTAVIETRTNHSYSVITKDVELPTIITIDIGVVVPGTLQL